jgi:hypothetical protein
VGKNQKIDPEHGATNHDAVVEQHDAKGNGAVLLYNCAMVCEAVL